MSQTETMEKEFTETELAGGESLIEDEDLTDEEYVEALGEHDEHGNEIVTDKSKKVKSPLTSPVHQKKKDDKEDKNLKNNEQSTDEINDVQVAVSSSGPFVPVDDSSPAPASDAGTNDFGVNSNDKEVEDAKDKNTDITKDDKKCTIGDKEVNDAEENYGDDVDDDVGDEDEDEEEEEEDDDDDDDDDDDEVRDCERDEDGESIEDGQEDGQENSELSKSNKELDDDEDRRNPQYIPKRGAFYEHDDRLGTDEEEEEEKEPEKDEGAVSAEKKPEVPVVEVRKAKKLWSDDAKWGHDMFDDEEQRPKPRDEIVSTYGYDIRNEDGPPKARRRRRYGRGPNRYTRSWKDEGAYSKPNETPTREKTKPDNENIKKDKDRPFISKDMNEKPIDISKRSGPRSQQRRTEIKSVVMEGNDQIERPDRMDRMERIDRNDRNDRTDRTDRVDRTDRFDRSDRKKPQREREGRDIGGPHRDNDRYRDHRRNVSNNRSPGPSKDLREFINSKNERSGDRRDDSRKNQPDLFENDFPELPQKSKDKMTRPQQYHQQSHQPQTTTVVDPNQPNAWSKIRPKHNDARDTIRGVENPLEYKTRPLRMGEPNDNGKSRPFNLSETNPKVEIVKTQTFENSRYFNRRPLTKAGIGHHQEPASNMKKDLPTNRNNRATRTRPSTERDFRNSGEVGRPITKTSHLADDHDDSGSGSAMEPQRRNRYNVNKERDFRSNHHGSDDRDRRGSELDPRGRSYLHDDRHYDNQFNDNQTDLAGGLNKLALMDKSNNRLSSSEANDSLNLAKPKRYSSLRQHQAQQQQQPQSEPMSQHKQPQPTPNQRPQESSRDGHPANSNLPQYPSTSQHLNLNHPRQSTNVQYYEAAAGANSQPPPPPPPSASFYIDNRSPQSSFGYIPTTNIEGGPNAARFLSQIAPRFIPPPTAPPPTAPEPRFMAQAVAAANPTVAAGPLPPVIPGPPAATYLPTYPPGYPQYPPPPPPTAAQFSIAPPPPQPSAAEMYRGGVTYYDTMTQQVSPRQLPQRRPKNALPIVPPPDLSNNPDGMMMNQGYEGDESDLNQNVETITC